MVLLTMTPAIVQALETVQKINDKAGGKEHSKFNDLGDHVEQTEPAMVEEPLGNHLNSSEEQDTKYSSSSDAVLLNPQVGNPISHQQMVALWKQTRAHQPTSPSLDLLLRGARIYVPPPPPKPEPTAEYKALMARLRREEEERTYDRMTNPPPPTETFFQRFPATSAAHAFSSNYSTKPHSDPFAETDEVTYADVDRQMAVIFNVLVSIIACAGGIWVVARWWSTPTRLALSMSGSLLVGVAEVVVYSGYVRRVGESKAKERTKKEIKQVTKTWTSSSVEDNQLKVNTPGSKASNPRQRRNKPA